MEVLLSNRVGFFCRSPVTENHRRFQTKVRGAVRSPEPQMDQILPQGNTLTLSLPFTPRRDESNRNCSFLTNIPNSPKTFHFCLSSNPRLTLTTRFYLLSLLPALWPPAVLSVLLRTRLPPAQPGLPFGGRRLAGRHQAGPRSGPKDQGGSWIPLLFQRSWMVRSLWKESVIRV